MTVLSVLIISLAPSRTSRLASISLSVESHFPVDGFFLDCLAARQVHRSCHDSSLPHLRGNPYLPSRTLQDLLECLGSHNLGTSRRLSAGSHPRGQGKGGHLGGRNARSAAASAAGTYSLLPLSPYSLTMSLLGWSLAAPHTHPYPTSPSRVVNKVGLNV